jgi:predicted methyltransferase
VTGPIVLSQYQIQPVLAARKEGRSAVVTSIDLGRTQIEVVLDADGVQLPGELLTWAQSERISDANQACFSLQNGELEKVQIFSPHTQRHYVLFPTPSAPTFLNSGVPMHRIKDTNPHADTLAKIKAIGPIFGPILDTCTGLGYTAIEAARTASQVITVEVDPAVLQIAGLNPWSRELFENPKITQWVGAIDERIEEIETASLSRVLHDPPAFNLAGDLYSTDFYRQLFRVLRKDGRLFHYIGDLESPSGRRVSRGAAERMRQAGFTRITPKKEAFGLLAFKS